MFECFRLKFLHIAPFKSGSKNNIIASSMSNKHQMLMMSSGLCRRHKLCLSSGSASFWGRLWRPSRFEGPSECAPQTRPSVPCFGGCTATILRGLTYLKILCEKEERKSENVRGVDRHFRRRDVRVKRNQEMLQRLDRPINNGWRG